MRDATHSRKFYFLSVFRLYFLFTRDTSPSRHSSSKHPLLGRFHRCRMRYVITFYCLFVINIIALHNQNEKIVQSI